MKPSKSGPKKGTTIKEAIKKWEEKTGEKASTAEEVSLIFQTPPIEKMDNTLAMLTNCRKLSLSTNMIDKITGISSLKNLRILSVGRNYIKSFAGLESLGDCLEELWISYNFIEKMKGIGSLKNLKVLYMSNNLVKEWGEFNKLQELHKLEDLLFVGNPLYDNSELEVWRSEVARRLPSVIRLDGESLVREDLENPTAETTKIDDQTDEDIETLVGAPEAAEAIAPLDDDATRKEIEAFTKEIEEQINRELDPEIEREMLREINAEIVEEMKKMKAANGEDDDDDDDLEDDGLLDDDKFKPDSHDSNKDIKNDKGIDDIHDKLGDTEGAVSVIDEI